MDFVRISTRMKSNGVVEIRPAFVTGKRKDLMTAGGDFYAFFIEEENRWSKDENDVIRRIDISLDKFVEENESKFPNGYTVAYMWDSDSGSIDRWHKYVKQQQRDNFVPLDSRLTFTNTPLSRELYSSKHLPYALEDGDISAYDTLVSRLYSPEERRKLEWAIGAVVSGDSVNIQKFVVLYGSAGTGKSTVLNIIQDLFDGYWSSFDSKALGSSNATFALEPFKDNPLVAIQHDGDLSRIEDNTRLNSLVSHEYMSVNTKNKSIYTQRFNSFLFMGTNKPVKITDAKSGLLRRLIDISPTGEKFPGAEYRKLIKEVKFEHGAIAYHCLKVYEEDPNYYDGYIPLSMMGATNDFYNFMLSEYTNFEESDGVTLSVAYDRYKKYVEESNSYNKLSRMYFGEELKNYFREFLDRGYLPSGERVRSYYKGFRTEKFESPKQEDQIAPVPFFDILDLKEQHSLLDDYLADCPAQEAIFVGDRDQPGMAWSKCKTTLKDIDTRKLHYILQKGAPNLIFLDFDFKDENGNKDGRKNLVEASKWPKTYAELSKSGAGIHLYYIYNGDVNALEDRISEDIEIKVPKGKSAIRRLLTKCNDIPIATISSGLPLKKGDAINKMVDLDVIKDKAQFEKFLKNCFAKVHKNSGSTASEISFIKKKLDEKYESGQSYDFSAYRNAVIAFAGASTNQRDNCINMVLKMHFKSDDIPMGRDEEPMPEAKGQLVIFDLEVYRNLIVICWKIIGDDYIHVMVNPTPEQVDVLFGYRLIGFNNRNYDNHILYAIKLGRSVLEVYNLSQSMINFKTGFIEEAKNASYTDIFDYCSVKQSLKKWEIQLKFPHMEMDIPWDQPVPPELVDKVIEYCKNDVRATEAVWNATQSDFVAREILADLTGLTVNHTTNQLTAALIFGNDPNPQREFNYRDLSLPVVPEDIPYEELPFKAWDGQRSAKPFFPSYERIAGKSYYRGEEVGEGGYVYSEKGVWLNVALLDITSQHPTSAEQEMLFGPKYTPIFSELKTARVIIKHAVSAKKNGDDAGYLFQLSQISKLEHIGEKLQKYLGDYNLLKNLPQALKIAINSVYGLTAASFKNKFKDPRNVDNIVAKRGALFMVDLKHAVQEKGFTVAHIKTDSIKIPDATPEIIEFVMNFGKLYGYSFEHEETYDRMALVNKAVYIAKYDHAHKDENGNDIWWTATGTQFQVPYVFKTLFSKEKIEFEDLCETKSVTGSSSLYLDFNENLPEGEHDYKFVGRVGSFCPIKPGCGGGILYREKDGKYFAATGTTGYRWKESEVVKHFKDPIGQIDISYYDHLCEEAVKAINELEMDDTTYQKFVNNAPFEHSLEWLLEFGNLPY